MARFVKPSGLLALALLGAAGSPGLAQQAGLEPARPGLGSQALCARYSGLPPRWGEDTRAGMVHLAGGDFVFGTTRGYADERQESASHVGGFWIDQTEVTVAQFASFVQATGYVTEAERQGSAAVFRRPSPAELQSRDYAWWSVVQGADWRHPEGPGSTAAPNQPVTLVTFADARAYAQWLGRELPTEAQWEFAAKAGRQGADLEKEPRDANGKPLANFWQGPFPSANTAEDGHIGLAPVGCFPGNGFKLYDMVGNAWEQTQDSYTGPHPPARSIVQLAPPPPANPAPNQAMVIKGGSHLCGRDFCVRYRPSAREAHEANLPTSHIGFRTVSPD